MNESQMQRGQQWLQELLHLGDLKVDVKSELHPDYGGDSCWLVIDDSQLSSDQITTLLGANGDVIDAMQYLANTILNLGLESDQQCAYTVELAGYRLRRFKELDAMAETAVAQVRETGQEYELKDLSAAERRQVHTILKEYGDLETFSRGQEPDRRLVVRPLTNE